MASRACSHSVPDTNWLKYMEDMTVKSVDSAAGRLPVGHGSVSKVATYVPVSQRVLEDSPLPYIWARIRRDLDRSLTCMFFDEEWSTPEREMERLELGLAVKWDLLVDEFAEEDDW